ETAVNERQETPNEAAAKKINPAATIKVRRYERRTVRSALPSPSSRPDGPIIYSPPLQPDIGQDFNFPSLARSGPHMMAHLIANHVRGVSQIPRDPDMFFMRNWFSRNITRRT